MVIDIKNIQDIKVRNPQDIYEIIHKIFYQKKDKVDHMKEHLWAISLNNAMNILNLELVSMGTKNRTTVDPGDVFRLPLYKSSSYVMIVHNHPSGNLNPSQADIDFTNKLIKAGELLDTPIVDHIIITEKSFFSFRLAGLLEKIRKDNKYGLTFVYKRKMEQKMNELKESVEKERRKIKLEGKQQGEKIGLEKGEKKRSVEIARAMLTKNMDTKIIQELTGLSRQWIGRLKNELEKKQ